MYTESQHSINSAWFCHLQTRFLEAPGNLWGCQLPPACPSSRTSANGSLLWEGTFDVATMHPTSFLQGWKSCKSGDWWAWHSLVFFPHVLFDKYWVIEGFLSFSINHKSDLHEADHSKANLNLGAFEARPGPRNTGLKKNTLGAFDLSALTLPGIPCKDLSSKLRLMAMMTSLLLSHCRPCQNAAHQVGWIPADSGSKCAIHILLVSSINRKCLI